MHFAAITIAMLAMQPAPLAQQPKAAELVATAAQAVEWAAADIVEVPEAFRPSTVYVWIPPHGEKDWGSLVNYAMNAAVSRANTIQKPVVTANGNLLRYDLATLAPEIADLIRLRSLWETLATDEPYFHVTATKIIPATKTAAARSIRVASFAPHLPLTDVTTLATHTRSAAPILRADWLTIKLLTTLGGGRYYDFAGFERNPKGRTAKDAVLAGLGANENLSGVLGGDQRAAMFRSEVTGKPRLVVLFRGVGGRAGSGLATITYDSSDDDVFANQHPILNLLRFKSAASEFIAEKPNGLHLFALFDAKGNLQNSVPDNIAADHTIPAPHTRRLEPAISCIRCHAGNDGLQNVKNDVTALLKRRGSVSLDVFDDVAQRKLTTTEVLDRLAGLYAGEEHFQRTLARGRDDYAEAVWRATDGLEPKAMAEGLSKLVAGYRYASVTPATAAFELGYRLPAAGGDGAELLGRLLPAGTTDFEDPRLGALKSGLPINRLDWEQVYADAARRAKLSTEE